ncbi:MAG: formylglycine-generating enzyme family protein [Opitutae bacterium]|nr:formylglycine-generating enzyme family protein [Opitutae bacterium]
MSNSSPSRARGLRSLFAAAVLAAVSVRAAEPVTVPGLDLVLVPVSAGTFRMGSPADEAGRYPNEGPPALVTIAHDFWLGKFEVTHAQWRALMGTDLVGQAKLALADDTLYLLGGKKQTIRGRIGRAKDADPRTLLFNTEDDAPMYLVNWDEAAAFCRKLTAHEQSAGRLPAGFEYRLPTEAEWEYACRAGTSTATYAGAMEIKARFDAPVLDVIAWYGGNSSFGYVGPGANTESWAGKRYPGGTAGPRSVGTRQPNAWGLFDLLGNVGEWCGDWYGEPLPAAGAVDPRGPDRGTSRVVRGGAWTFLARRVRAANRSWIEPGLRLNVLGFRVALAPVQP